MVIPKLIWTRIDLAARITRYISCTYIHCSRAIMSAEHTMQGVTTTTEGTSTCDHSVEKGKGKAPEKIEQTQGQDSSSDEEDVGSVS